MVGHLVIMGVDERVVSPGEVKISGVTIKIICYNGPIVADC